MSIDKLTSNNVARTYVQNSDAARSAPTARHRDADKARTTRADSVELSSTARSVANAREAAKNAPEVREQKVADIKHRIESGTYEVPARVLARNMLDASSPNHS